MRGFWGVPATSARMPWQCIEWVGCVGRHTKAFGHTPQPICHACLTSLGGEQLSGQPAVAFFVCCCCCSRCCSCCRRIQRRAGGSWPPNRWKIGRSNGRPQPDLMWTRPRWGAVGPRDRSRSVLESIPARSKRALLVTYSPVPSPGHTTTHHSRHSPVPSPAHTTTHHSRHASQGSGACSRDIHTHTAAWWRVDGRGGTGAEGAGG